MSFYSQFVNVRYLEPESHNPNNRTEFKLPNNIYAYPNLRLVNVGLSGAVGSISKIGCVSLIKHLYLYSDRELIDSLRFANIFHSFNQLTVSNASNRSINSVLEKSAVGYVIDQSLQSGHEQDRRVTGVANDPINGSGGYIEVSRLLQILQTQGFILDTAKFPNLRLVIEWETEPLKYLSEGTNNAFTVVSPTLIYDEIESPEIGASLSAQMGNVNFSSIEHDSFQVPNISAQNNGHRQVLDSRLKGFDKKFVNRFILVKNIVPIAMAEGPGNTIRGKGFFRSPVQHHEKINCKVNGQQIFDEEIGPDATKNYITADAWGPLNVQFYEDKMSVGLDNPNDGQLNFNGIPSDMVNVVGFGSYFGFRVEQKIEDLEIHYQREKPNDNTAATPGAKGRVYEQHLNVNVFAECAKQLIYGKNGQFTVRYL